jgi:NADH-quinone oxidoreductase subunit M
LYTVHPVLMGVAGLSLILGAAYMLKLFRLTMLGEAKYHGTSFKLTRIETLTLSLIAAGILILGIYPQPLLKMSSTFPLTKQSACSHPEKGEAPWYP